MVNDMNIRTDMARYLFFCRYLLDVHPDDLISRGGDIGDVYACSVAELIREALCKSTGGNFVDKYQFSPEAIAKFSMPLDEAHLEPSAERKFAADRLCRFVRDLTRDILTDVTRDAVRNRLPNVTNLNTVLVAAERVAEITFSRMAHNLAPSSERGAAEDVLSNLFVEEVPYLEPEEALVFDTIYALLGVTMLELPQHVLMDATLVDIVKTHKSEILSDVEAQLKPDRPAYHVTTDLSRTPQPKTSASPIAYDSFRNVVKRALESYKDHDHDLLYDPDWSGAAFDAKAERIYAELHGNFTVTLHVASELTRRIAKHLWYPVG